MFGENKKGEQEQKGTDERDISKEGTDVDEGVGSGSLRDNSSELKSGQRRVDHKTPSSIL